MTPTRPIDRKPRMVSRLPGISRRLPSTIILLTAALCSLASVSFVPPVLATLHALTPAPALAGFLPQGALLTIESPDFATLLHDWSTSPECRSWLAGENYTVFSNSRLFGRLADAQTQFFSTAFTRPNRQAEQDPSQTGPAASAFLTQVAGKQTVFAWYNVQRLEFLYITRMSSAQSLQNALLRERSHFTARQAGGQTFYVRSAPATAITPDAPIRTVAFATVSSPQGDLLLLATREDLLATSLELLAANSASSGAKSVAEHGVQPQAQPQSQSQPQSLADEPWYAEASAAQPPSESALHMVLNLDRIVPLPAFRTYWVQQNLTEMSKYRSAVTDLYREPAGLREERTLLLKAPAEKTESALDLTAFASLAPAAGVYRASATQDPADAVAALEDKLLGRRHLPQTTLEQAPDLTLSVANPGDATDLETSIETPAPVSATYSNQALTQALTGAGLDALLTYSAASLPPPGAPDGASAGMPAGMPDGVPGGTPIWVPVHNAVLLHGANAFNLQALESALQQSLRGNLTTGTLGIEFHPTADPRILALTGPKPLYLAVDDSPYGHLAVLADDAALAKSFLNPNVGRQAPGRQALDSQGLGSQGLGSQSHMPATIVAGFNHAAQRAPYARLTSLIDGTNQTPANSTVPVIPAQPAYFSQNLRSLSDAFATLKSETFTQSQTGAHVRQTVLYQWQ